MEIVDLKQAEEVSSNGGKASSLAQLLVAGFPVPSGFVVHLKDKLTSEHKDQILTIFDKLDSQFVAVRSSALNEDGSNTSWAGQLETFLNVTRPKLIEAIEKCHSSANTQRALAYAKQNNIPAGSVAVLVQAMVQSETSGVVFSVHPVTQSKDQLVIEAVSGLGEALVSGEVTPDTYIIQKADPAKQEVFISNQTKQLIKDSSGETTWQPVFKHEQKLSTAQITEVAQVVIKLEKYFNYPVDVEWAYFEDKLYILQARPITTLS